MPALTLFNQNFAVAERLLQLYQLAGGLQRSELPGHIRRSVLQYRGEPENTLIQHMSNDRITILTRPTARIPDLLMEQNGLDFLLRQAVVAACTCLEAFLWDMVRENILTIVRARRRGADDELKNLTLTLEDYVSVEQYQDRDARLRQIILKNFERRVLYDADSIDRVARILTVRNFWERVEKISGEPSTNLKRLVGDLITRRNRIAHRADRPRGGDEVDQHGLSPISFSWTNMRIQAVKTLVTAAAEILTGVIAQLEQDIRARGRTESLPAITGD